MGDLRKMFLETRSFEYRPDISIYKQRSNRTKPKVVFRKRSHEIGFIKYGHDMSCL